MESPHAVHFSTERRARPWTVDWHMHPGCGAAGYNRDPMSMGHLLDSVNYSKTAHVPRFASSATSALGPGLYDPLPPEQINEREPSHSERTVAFGSTKPRRRRHPTSMVPLLSDHAAVRPYSLPTDKAAWNRGISFSLEASGRGKEPHVRLRTRSTKRDGGEKRHQQRQQQHRRRRRRTTSSSTISGSGDVSGGPFQDGADADLRERARQRLEAMQTTEAQRLLHELRVAARMRPLDAPKTVKPKCSKGSVDDGNWRRKDGDVGVSIDLLSGVRATVFVPRDATFGDLKRLIQKRYHAMGGANLVCDGESIDGEYDDTPISNWLRPATAL